jgi:predicted Zn-dependent protease
MENGNPAAGLPAIKEALRLLPANGLLQMLNAQILVTTEDPKNADEALALLNKAKRSEGDAPILYKYMARAYALKNDVPRAELATAEYAWLTGDKKMAITKATSAQNFFKRGSPEWLRASDLLIFAKKK